MKEYTSKYIRPPPTHPVPFIGFEFAKIPSREIVEHRLNQVLKKTREATTLTVTIIRAEWGEGKTDAFERYIKPEVECEGDVAYLVSTSTIINKLSKANALLPTSPPESVTLLSIIFHSIKDELRYKNEDYSRFPDENIHEDPYIYLTKVLQNHMTAKTKKRMYIFIDEFEEILIHSPELQKKFLSGLKELINGQLKMIHTDGEFQGCVHFFIACTPYAYNRLKEDVTLKEIFGSISSRIGTNIIDLPQISRNEAIQFLVDILRYCYNGKLPSPLPIKSAGVLNGIATISQRNLRPMIQFMGELLSTASTNDKLEVIDYHIFIDAMRGREISVFGETTSCIDEDLLTKIERTLLNVKIYGTNCLELFRLLAGELKPFSLQEIETRLGLEGDQIHNLVEIINQELSKILIPKAISRLMPLKDEKDIGEAINSLNPVGNSIHLAHNDIPLNKFYEEFVHYEVDENGRLKPILVIPKDEEEILKAFEVFEDIKIDEDDAKSLKHKLEKFLESLAKDTKFMLSKELSLQLFPSPVTSQIDFIEDRQKRIGLWREAIKNFSDMGRALRDGFIEVINSSDEFKIYGTPNAYTLECYLQPGIKTVIRVAIYASTIGININDVEQARDILKKGKVDLLLLLYAGTMDEDASRELSNIPKVLVIQLKTIRAQQLIALSLAHERGFRINDKILKGKLELIYHEVGFSKLFSSWMEICKNKGILITDLIKTSGEKDKDLADAMVYYLEKIGHPLTFESIYENLDRLRSFTMYGAKGTKAPFCPFDIEKQEDLQIYQKDLVKNGFIKEREDGTLEILLTPIEQRILELVKRDIRTIEEIKRNFIIIAQNENIIEQVYLPVLESKGLLIVEKDNVKLLDFKYFETETVKEYNAYRDKIEKMKKEYWDYLHICISKERESKVIMIEDFDNFLKQLWLQYEDVQIRYNEELRARLFRIISALLKYFNEALYPTINDAINRGKEIVKEIDQCFVDTELLISGILLDFNKYSDKKYKLEDVEEYKQLIELKEKVKERLNKVYTREEIEEGVYSLENTIYSVKEKYELYPKYFYFKKPPKDASYFNFKVYDAEQSLKRVKSKKEEITNECNQIIRYMNDAAKYYNEISAKLAKYDISDAYKLSKNIFNLLKSYQEVPIKAPQLAYLSLKDVESFFNKLYSVFKDHSSKIEISLNKIKDLIEKEKTLNSAKTIIFAKVNNFKFFFEGYESETKIIGGITPIIEEINNKYESICKSSVSLGENIKGIDEFNETAQEKLNNLIELISSLNRIDNKLRELYEEKIKYITSYHSSITKMLDVLKESGEDATGLKKAFEQTVDLAIGYLNNLLLENNVKVKWRDIEEELMSMKNQLLDRVKLILSKEEFEVLLLIVEKTATRRWLTLPEIIEDIASVLNKGKEEVSETIERLANKKLLKKGISLPIEVS